MSAEFFEEEEFQTKFNGKTFRRILSLAKPHWKMVAGFLGTILIVSGLDSFFTYLGKQIIDEGIVARNPDALIRILALYGGLIVIQAIGVFGFIYMVGILGERIRYDLRQNMFNHLQKLSLAYFSKTPVGWIMARVTSDTERVSELITWGILDSAWGAVNIITSMFFMFRINWKLALIVLGILPILFVIAIEFRKRIIKQYRKVRKQNSKIVGAYNENITGVRVVKALVRENENLREFGEITADMYRASYRATWLSALFLPSVQLVTAFAVGAIVWYGGYQSTIGGLSVGGIQAFISYITFMMWPIQDLARVFAEMQHAIASAER
ncbi:MAG TPA: ABC transporter transmembrane domain-containing protein, partial [Anaerolineaceae bacterium]|nr:ABC transporter transmembrane domain-containing protein [Anaerolineaceae bacterium]